VAVPPGQHRDGPVSLYRHILHPHVARRQAAGPVIVAAQLPQGNAYTRFNTRVAIAVTRGVGSMSCAWAFAAIALISLPAAIASGSVIIIVSWVAQTFLQLVLLAVIMVGQGVQAAASDARSAQEFGDVEAVLHGQGEQANHLDAQDGKILAILAEIRENTDLTKALAAGKETP